jgi:hypothetical protein
LNLGISLNFESWILKFKAPFGAQKDYGNSPSAQKLRSCAGGKLDWRGVGVGTGVALLIKTETSQ